MGVLDPLPLHRRTTELSARAKRALIRSRIEHLRNLADMLEEVANDEELNDDQMTEHVNALLRTA